MKTIIFLGLLLIAMSVLYSGYTVSQAINKSAGWELQKAYMNGKGFLI